MNINDATEAAFKNGFAAAVALIEADIKTMKVDACHTCVHNSVPAECAENDFDCVSCGADCRCKTCMGNSEYEWRHRNDYR